MGLNFLLFFDKIILKFRDKWPPYPQNFKIPEEIKSMWNYKFYYKNKSMAILKGDFNLQGGLHVGDRFNGIVLPKKRKRGIRYSDRNHRIYQFYLDEPRFFGKVVFDSSYLKDSILEKGRLTKGLVYRFEIISINTKKRVFYFNPLKNVFNKQNLLQNLIDCNYQMR